MLVTVYVDGGQAGVRAATTALAAAGDPNRPVVPLAARRIKLSLSGRLMVAAGQPPDAVAAAAKAAMSSSAGGLFSPGRMGIGQRLHSSAVGAALMVPGVTAIDQLVVTGPEQVLAEVLDPGDGAYFHLPRKRISIGWVSASG
jgi:phage-related baseplate assembly protein